MVTMQQRSDILDMTKRLVAYLSDKKAVKSSVCNETDFLVLEFQESEYIFFYNGKVAPEYQRSVHSDKLRRHLDKLIELRLLSKQKMDGDKRIWIYSTTIPLNSLYAETQQRLDASAIVFTQRMSP